MRATDLVASKLTPPGFYYKTFIRPRKLWPVYEKVLRNAAGLGKLRHEQAEREWRTEYRRRHADVLVVGGGIAGLSAAVAAAQQGADVVLADEGPALGGQQLIEPDRERVQELIAACQKAGVELLEHASALGYFDGLVPVWQDDTLHQVRAARHIFATGTIEQPLVFAGNDLPGVMLAGGARRLASLYAVSPGQRAVVVTTSDRGLTRRRDTARAGRRAGGGGRPASRGQRGRPRAAAQRRPGVHRPHGGRGQGPQGRGRGGDRARRRRRRALLRLRPAGRLRRHDPGHFAAAAGRGPERV